MMNRIPWLVAFVLLVFSSLSAYGQGEVKQEMTELKRRLTTHTQDAESHYQLAMLLDQAQQKKEALAHWETAIQLDPQNLKYGNEYRLRCVADKEYDRAINFFENLVKARDLSALRLQLAMAYVDKLPAPGPAGLLGQAALSGHSIRELTKILEKAPDQYTWAALYARGLNLLHWPRALTRTPEAIADFKKLLALQASQGKTAKAYFVLTYIALGDAYAKDGQFKQARDLWQTGLDLFPGNPELRKRLAIPSEANEEKLVAFINEERGLKVTINTDLSIFWK